MSSSVETPAEKPAGEFERVDMTALTGLRGLLALWVCGFHTVGYSQLQWDLQGSPVMPPFFILSGFCLAVCYGGRGVRDVVPCCGEWRTPWARGFYVNRFARLAPVYYLVTAASIPLIYLGYSSGGISKDVGAMLYHLIPNAFGVQMWIFTGSICGPAWTVSTLAFFYVLFPRLLPVLQRASVPAGRFWRSTAWLTLGVPCQAAGCCSSDEAAERTPARAVESWGMLMGHCWIAQFVVGVVIAVALVLLGMWEAAFWASTAWPPSRLPVFLMGCYGGLLRTAPAAEREASEVEWERKAPIAPSADFTAAYILVHLVAFSACSIFVRNTWGSGWWLQFWLVGDWSTLIYQLTLEKERGSYASRFLRSGPLLWLGKVSYSLSLVPLPLRNYVAYGLRGSRGARPDYDKDDDDLERWNNKFFSPAWTIAPVIAASVVLAGVLEALVERPARARLRTAEPKQLSETRCVAAEA